MTDAPLAIRTRGLEVRYDDQLALCHLDLDLPCGSSLAVIGANGSGKSTFLGVLAGTVDASAGTAELAGGRPAFVLQSTEVDRSMPITVEETVALGRYPTLGLFRRFGTADRAIVATALERMDITDLAHRQLHDLSGGQRQRVLVAQGLAQDADVLLLDEPVTGLDVVSRQIILDVIDEEVARDRAVIVTTHHLDEARRCDQVLILDSHAIAIGPPDEVLTEDNLRAAFGAAFSKVGDELVLDDPHHHDH